MTNIQSIKTSCEADNQNGKEPIFLSDYFEEIFEDFIAWLSRVNYAKETIKSRKRHIKRFFDWLQANNIYELEQVRKQNLEAYNEYLHGTSLARKTIEAHISALKVLNKFRAAYELAPVLTTRLMVTKEVMIKRVVLSGEEIEALYGACDDSVMGWRDRAILAIYYGCGLRCNEGINLQVRDINFETELLLVRKAKGYKQRYVPMSAGTKEILKDWLSQYKPLLGVKSNLILPRSDGKIIKGTALNNRVKKLAQKAEIDQRVTLHVLRHSIATHLVENGMEIESVGLFLGHQTLQSTTKYVHVRPEI